jgi:AcrR family transcriptional regulator
VSADTERVAARRRRVPAAERRRQLIEAAVVEFARGGLHGTAVAQIARRVGVAQPYVFSLFPSKRDLFLAAVESGFERIAEAFSRAAEEYERGEAPEECEDVMEAMGRAYTELLASDRDYLMLQHQSFAACEDAVVRERVRRCFAELIEHVRRLANPEEERLDDFLRYGMALNVAAALGVGDLCGDAQWVADALDGAQ